MDELAESIMKTRGKVKALTVDEIHIIQIYISILSHGRRPVGSIFPNNLLNLTNMNCVIDCVPPCLSEI